MRRRTDQSLTSGPPHSNGAINSVTLSETCRQDFVTLSTSISNGDDLGPFVRRAFASSRPDSILQHLRLFSRSKESEIEELCKAHYTDFIRAVDDLRSLLTDVDDLKTSLSDNRLLITAGSLLLGSYLTASMSFYFRFLNWNFEGENGEPMFKSGI